MTPTLHSLRPRRRDAAENRAAILVAAAAALNRNPGATLETIAAEAGLSRRALYGHFRTREDLIAELLARGASRVSEAIVDIDRGNSRVAIARIGSRLWREVDDVRVMARFAERGRFADDVTASLMPLRHLLLAVVQRGVAAGELRQDMEPGLLARLIEGTALAVLDEANRTTVSRADGTRLVVYAGLAMAGLSWTECHQTITELEMQDMELSTMQLPSTGLPA